MDSKKLKISLTMNKNKLLKMKMKYKIFTIVKNVYIMKFNIDLD